MGYVVLIILLVLSFLLVFRSPFKTGLSKKDLIIGWSVKVLYSCLYVYIFMYYYRDGKMDFDLWNFYNDSRIINQYGKDDPAGYTKLLFGFQEDEYGLMTNELENTHVWIYVDNGDFINDNRLLLRFNSIVHFISFGNVYVHIIIMAFLSYLGLLQLFKAFKKYVSNQRLFYYLLCGLPSIGFWTSGFTKEAILMFALGMFFFNVSRLIERFDWKYTTWLIVSIIFLFLNKPYVGLILLPISVVLIPAIRTKWNWRWMFIWSGIIVSGLLFSMFAPSKFNIVERVTLKQKDQMNMAEGGVFFINDTAFCAFGYEHFDHFEFQDKDYVKVNEDTKGEYKLFGPNDFYDFTIPADTTWYELYLIQVPAESFHKATPVDYSKTQLVKNIPDALFTSFMRPIPSDSGGNLKYVAFSSNLFFMGLLIFSLVNRKKLEPSAKYLVFTCVSAAIVIALIIGWTTPILGAVFRYKSSVEILLLISIFIWMKPLKYFKNETNNLE